MTPRSKLGCAVLLLLAACGAGASAGPPEQCVLGWWSEPGGACGLYYCSGHTDVPECQASDCKEQNFLHLSPDGGQLSGTLAISLANHTLSAPNHSAQPLRWGIADTKIYLASTPGLAEAFSCDASRLSIGAAPTASTWVRMTSTVAAAMTEAADSGQWVSVPIK